MKKFILILIAVLSLDASSHAGWFDSQPSQHEQQLQQQLQQEQHQNSECCILIIALGVGCIATLIVGTMIGSRTRRKAHENKQTHSDAPVV